jgi:AbrB family looped-hinge helix DNA binding protein
MVTTPKKQQDATSEGSAFEEQNLTSGSSRLTSKGQVTVPAALRRAAGLKPGDRVFMQIDPDGSIRMQRLRTFPEIVAAIPKVPPIDWKAAREEMAEDIARKIQRDLGLP